MNDSISRQRAIETALSYLVEYCGAAFDEDMQRELKKRLDAIPSARPGIDRQGLFQTITAGIIATSTKDVYSCGMRNGMRWCRGLLEEGDPKFEDASLYAQPEIIRCKDCKWCEDADGLMCKNTASWVAATENDFGCILAERRTDG